MTEAGMKVILEVVAENAEAIQKVDSSITSLAKTTDKQTALVKKGNEEEKKRFDITIKQSSAYREIAPIMNRFGLSSLMGAGAIATLAVNMMKMGQTLTSNMGQLGLLGMTINNQTTGPLITFSTMVGNLIDLSLKWGVSVEALTKGLEGMNPTIHENAQREKILADALELHLETGIPLKDLIKALSDALASNSGIWDRNTDSILQGNNAYNQVIQNAKAMENGFISLNTKYNDFVDSGIEKVKTALGLLGMQLFNIVRSPFALLELTLEANIYNFKVFQTLLPAVGTWFQDLGENIKNFFIDRLNDAISLINQIIGLVNRIPGFNIPVIPPVNPYPYQPAPPGYYTPPAPEPIYESYRSSFTSAGQTINLYLSDGTQLASWVMGKFEEQVRARTAY